MTTFILIHGSWHTGESWHKVKACLEEKGARFGLGCLSDSNGSRRDAHQAERTGRLVFTNRAVGAILLNTHETSQTIN